MKQLITEGIILSRTDYGEADRIITLLTPDHGKLTLMAKGVRRIKSKLAGGIELFSVSAITFTPGRGSMGTLLSTRLAKHYGTIVQDLDRTMLGYELIKQLNKITEDQAEAEYFELLKQVFEALDDASISIPIVRLWFWAQLLRLGGHTPNLQTDAQGKKLQPDQQYAFNHDDMCFMATPGGLYGTDHIKLLRLALAGHQPKTLAQVNGGQALLADLTPLVSTMLQVHLRV